MSPVFDEIRIINNGGDDIKPKASNFTLYNSWGSTVCDSMQELLRGQHEGDLVCMVDSDERPDPKMLKALQDYNFREPICWDIYWRHFWFTSKPSVTRSERVVFTAGKAIKIKSRGMHVVVDPCCDTVTGLQTINHYKGENAYLLTNFLFWLSDSEHHWLPHLIGGEDWNAWQKLREKHNVDFSVIQQWIRTRLVPIEVVNLVKTWKNHDCGHLHQLYLFLFERNMEIDYPNDMDFSIPENNYDCIRN